MSSAGPSRPSSRLSEPSARPTELPHNNPGYDIRSTFGDGETFLIEVKGRIVGATDVVVTRTELLTAKNLGDAYRLPSCR